MITAIKIEKIVKTGAKHKFYREDGRWYHCLKDFPGVLFDIDGYIIFTTKGEYLNNRSLHHGKQLNVSGSISQMKGYKKFTEDEKKQISNIL